MQWSEQIVKQAHDYIKQKLPVGAFVGIHLRNGIDWVKYLLLKFLSYI
jgi:peptide-O-fucosyltransferase